MIEITDYHFLEELQVENIIPKKINEVALKYRSLLLEDIEKNIIEIENIDKCYCCGDSLEVLSKIDRFGLPFGSKICQKCGLITTSPRIKEKSLPYYYDKYYHHINYGKENLNEQKALFEDGQGRKVFHILKNHLPAKKILKVLEIGAGTGSVLHEFKEEASLYSIGIDELGTEYSSDCIKQCNEKNLNVIYGNLETILKKNETYDVIILSHVFEHFIDLDNELGKIRKIMNKDSLLYIEVPGVKVNHKKGYYEYSYLIYHVHAHMYNFSFRTLNNILLKNNFINLFGNEEVESIYQIAESKNNTAADIYLDYNHIIEYLFFLKQNQNYWKELYQQKIYFEKQYKQQQQTITNREATIQGKESLIQKQQKTIENSEVIIQKKESLMQKQQKTIENREKTIKGKVYKLSKIENYLYLILHSIEEVTLKSFSSNPIEKYKAYKQMLKTFDKIKGYLKNGY
ncbi:methyltransferase domain-containing protein [Sulfurimonas sp.]|uniref:class I SAM-dependent methyltransferase n=1 Tax=Sulfurimonas sp. TaxID=2022749 RepID=UPI00262AB194|nr:methyltransferase domain-containing protein [Sulfurimonas sp.]